MKMMLATDCFERNCSIRIELEALTMAWPAFNWQQSSGHLSLKKNN